MMMTEEDAILIGKKLPGCKIYPYWPGQVMIAVAEVVVNDSKLRVAIHMDEYSQCTVDEIADLLQQRLVAGFINTLKGI